MTQKKLLIGLAAAVVLGIGWYLFRPELLFINQTVHEDFPSVQGQPTSAAGDQETVLAQGNFHKVAHQGMGKATIYQLAGGKRLLRLTDFETSNGPALHVYLVAAADATDSATVQSAGFIDLGALKGNIGAQNYEVPAEVDLARYRAVTIWCQRFSVNFTTAPLSAPVATTQPVELARGQFHKVAHQTKGQATLFQLADGKRVLRLTDFETSNGPALHVYLVAAQDANDSATVQSARFIDLGALKGNIGAQNYEVPAEADLSTYQAVTIWCQRFSVNFGTAPLHKAK